MMGYQLIVHIKRENTLSLAPLIHTAAVSAKGQSNVGPGWQRQGGLWAGLDDICTLLRIPKGRAIQDADCLFQHLHFKAGQRIHRAGEPFDMLYIVNSGFLKTVLIDPSGHEQILSFPMKGDLFGIDGIHARQYLSDAVALASCDIILVPFAKFSELGRIHPEFEMAIYSAMSRELTREHSMVSMLGSLNSEARVARFLVSLSDRFAEMGYSNKQFNLRMTRHEIGSYLGLTLETVSRTLSAFNEIGLISVDQRAIEINDIEALRSLRRLPTCRTSEKKAKVRVGQREIPGSGLRTT